MTFAEQLKQARNSAGLTQEKMAVLFEIPKRSIENWESSKSAPPPWSQRLILKELERLQK